MVQPSKRFLDGEWSIVEEVAYATGAPLRGLNFQRTDGGWLLVVKTLSHQRGALVAFFGGETPEDCLALFLSTANSQPGVNWKPDRYAK